ncbi:regulatory protein RecX [Rhodothermus marinus]|uniref:regulatory protein RecX n=1 Tax=Rhodothermus marinus TaxID=29549 RepID=UPI000223D967|nr:RecX family transcriptional regulator [Rhodothermus marinus]AEN74121.1 Regulatory protein recX [Rhodothermus marinus SG0.5JP17-172]MBO2490903.1 recombinase RecX [Rhodothermus marinus]BBM68843.1 regulatory protein RecX [Rhodothermus marinus]BBM71823.1 regulatory protein RecX [Rhodothermus marinus]
MSRARTSKAPEPPVFREGVVTRLEPQTYDPERVSIFIDGAFWMGVHRDVLREHPVEEGQMLPLAVQQALYRAELVRKAQSVALRYLEHRPRTVQEVRRRLERAGFPVEVIDQMVARLEALGYLDDRAYARAYVQGRLAGRGYGPRRLQAELRRRGVPPDVVEATLDAALAETDPLEIARPLARRRWKLLCQNEPDRRKRRQKLIAFLQRRGFSSEIAYTLLRELD